MKINIVCPNSAKERLESCMPTALESAGSIEFSINGEEMAYDGVVVLQSTSGYNCSSLSCPRGNALLVVREPQDILRMPARYVRQFDHVLTPNRKVSGVHTIYSQFGQLWTVNRSYKELDAMAVPEKTKLISTVVSTKRVTKGHRFRFDLTQAIAQELGDAFDWYGRGVRKIEDKWDAIAPYKYHLVFENGQWPHYWSEKLTDAFVGFSMPIYVGCPNIIDYFQSDAIVILDARNLEKAISQLKSIISDDPYDRSFHHLLAARNKVIREYSLFHKLEKIIQSHFCEKITAYRKIELGEFENVAYRYSPEKMLRRLRYRLVKGVWSWNA